MCVAAAVVFEDDDGGPFRVDSDFNVVVDNFEQAKKPLLISDC